MTGEVVNMDKATSTSYEKPVVRDYGTVSAQTAASGLTGAEDGGNKITIHHVSDGTLP